MLDTCLAANARSFCGEQLTRERVPNIHSYGAVDRQRSREHEVTFIAIAAGSAGCAASSVQRERHGIVRLKFLVILLTTAIVLVGHVVVSLASSIEAAARSGTQVQRRARPRRAMSSFLESWVVRRAQISPTYICSGSQN